MASFFHSSNIDLAVAAVTLQCCITAVGLGLLVNKRHSQQ